MVGQVETGKIEQRFIYFSHILIEYSPPFECHYHGNRGKMNKLLPRALPLYPVMAQRYLIMKLLHKRKTVEIKEIRLKGIIIFSAIAKTPRRLIAQIFQGPEWSFQYFRRVNNSGKKSRTAGRTECFRRIFHLLGFTWK